MLKKILLAGAATALLLVLAFFFFVSFFQETKTLDAASRSVLPGAFIPLSDGVTHYETGGPDTGKTVILIHGAGSGYYAWDNNYDFLVQKGFKVLRYDLYGRGFSDRPEVVYDTTLFCRQLEELTQQLHLKPPYHLAAVSMGASVALQYSLKHATEVASLTLVDPAALSDGSLPFYLKNPITGRLLMSLYWYPRAVEKQMKEYYDPALVPEYRQKSQEHMRYKGLTRAMLSTWQHMLTLNMTGSMQKLGNLPVKVQLIWGKYDPLIHPEVSAHYIKAMPQSNFLEIDRAGHLSNYERPDVFNPAFAKFLRDEK